MAAITVNLRTQDYDVYIGRGGRWGNKFVIGQDGNRLEVIRKYDAWMKEEWMSGRLKLDDLLALDGKRLGCYCSPKPCHGWVLEDWVTWALEVGHEWYNRMWYEQGPEAWAESWNKRRR